VAKVGLVAIGRNEGERLRRCLLSVRGKLANTVYVDSGSTDGSVAMAKLLAADVVELDLSIPFTAARARNSGLEHLLKIDPSIEFVQFVDGDCEIVGGWIERALEEFNRHRDVAIVCGRRRECFPEKSLYNQLCDIEWDTPIGETKACGGDFLIRVASFQQIGGFNPTLIAGEEPELCLRLRQCGWKISRLNAEMTLHDAQMSNFSQWWKRSLRAGYAYAEGGYLHGKSPERHWVKENRSNWFWGLLLPLLIMVLAWITHCLSFLLLFSYPLLAYRIYHRQKQRELSPHNAALYALFCVLSKFAQVQGQIQFHWNRLRRKRSGLIEYKVLVTHS
jgi:GT2 family glycosyltransferase